MPSVTNIGATPQYKNDNVGQALNPIDIGNKSSTGTHLEDDDNSTNVFTQSIPSIIWVVLHKLNRFPSVTLVDSMGRVVQPDIEYISPDEIHISFAFPMIGKAYLN